MAQRLAELCNILVEDAFGELAAQIFSTLSEHGRLSLYALRIRTGLLVHRLNRGLAILIQHHIVKYHSSSEDEPTYFSIDWHAAYFLVRSAKFRRIVEDSEGQAAAGIVSTVLQSGHTSVGELAYGFNFSPNPKRDSGIDTVEEHMTEEGLLNGIAKLKHKESGHGRIRTLADLHSTLRKLLKKGYLVKVNHRTFVPQADLEEQVQDIVKSEQFPDGKITGSKKAKEFSTAVNTLKRKWHSEDSYSQTKDLGAFGEIVKSKGLLSGNKRVKLNGGLTNGVHRNDEVDSASPAAQPDQRLPNDMTIRVNFTKCAVVMRTQRLEQMADGVLGPITASVFGALLHSVEGQIDSTNSYFKVDNEAGEEDEEDFLLRAYDADVLELVDNALDLSGTIKCDIASRKLPNSVNNHRGRNHVVVEDDDAAELGIKQEHHSNDEDDAPEDTTVSALKHRNKRMALMQTHLDILTEHPKDLITRIPDRKESEVNFPSLVRTLVQSELDAMIHARFGKIAVRLIRMLRDKGMMEDQIMGKMAMMRVQDVRGVLTALQFHGLVEIQELPKDNGRQPSRTIYLYQLDEAGMRSLYLQQTYQGMARLLQRLAIERSRNSVMIDKAERADVRGHEDEVLGPAEKSALKKWRDLEERMLTQLSRMDDVVAVLRDFDERDTSLSD